MVDPVIRKVKTAFWPGDHVYLAIRSEPHRGMVIETSVSLGGVRHIVTWEDGETTDHYEPELTVDFVPDFARQGEDEGEAIK